MMPPSEGRELNPLLQDFGLAVHPPMLYMGYVGLAIPFAFVLSALIRGQLDSTWIRFVEDKDGRGPGISAFYIEVHDKSYLKEKAKEQGLFHKKNIVIGGVRFVLV